MKRMNSKTKFLFLPSLLSLTLVVLLSGHSAAFDTAGIFFAGDSGATYCRQSSSGTDLYQQSLFGRLQASPPAGFIIEPPQAILARDPCNLSNPDGSGYGGLKILDWNTECTDASGNGICGWSCSDCPDPECEINRNALQFGGEANWCCCASRKSCIVQSDAQYIILNVINNDLFQLFKFYGRDADMVVEEAKTLTNFLTSQGRTVIWLSYYPIGYGSLGNGESACSDPLSCLLAANSNAEYFYARLIPWINSQSNVYLIDFFGHIKETYASNPLGFINTYGYDGVHLTPAGHQIYYDYVYPRLTAIVTGGTDQDGDGIPDDADNCPAIANADQADMDLDGIGNVCDDDADGDTYVIPADCNDNDPAINPGAVELCSDGKDNNCDLNADCKDVVCLSYPACSSVEICNDGIDNDRDRKVDCKDTDCRNNPVCTNCVPKGGLCTVNGDCCSNRCRGNVCR